MAKVTGLGGVFVKANDKDTLATWYRESLGVNLEEYGGINFNWRNAEDPEKKGYTLFSLFEKTPNTLSRPKPHS